MVRPVVKHSAVFREIGINTSVKYLNELSFIFMKGQTAFEKCIYAAIGNTDICDYTSNFEYVFDQRMVTVKST